MRGPHFALCETLLHLTVVIFKIAWLTAFETRALVWFTRFESTGSADTAFVPYSPRASAERVNKARLVDSSDFASNGTTRSGRIGRAQKKIAAPAFRVSSWSSR